MSVTLNDRWRGFQLEVRPDPLHPDRYEVEFWPNEMMAASGPEGEFHAIARGTVVTLEDQGVLKVLAFHPSEQQYSDLQRADYEEKAREVLWDYRLKKSL